jgi:hypothetical protein
MPPPIKVRPQNTLKGILCLHPYGWKFLEKGQSGMARDNGKNGDDQWETLWVPREKRAQETLGD